MRIRLLAVSVALMIAGGMAEAQDRLLTVTCAEAGALELPVPEGWTVQESRHDVRMPPTVTLSAPDGQAQWVVTAVWKAADRKPPSTLPEIRTRVQRTAETVGAATAPLQPLPAKAPTGYFFDAGAGHHAGTLHAAAPGHAEGRRPDRQLHRDERCRTHRRSGRRRRSCRPCDASPLIRLARAGRVNQAGPFASHHALHNFHSMRAASAISSSENSRLMVGMGSRCAARAPSGVVNRLAATMATSAGRCT
jgi:hypothetical protein